GEGEREDALARINSSPGGVPAADAAPRRDDPAAAAPPSRQESPIERSRSVAREERFGKLREIWQRGWQSDDTPKAMAVAEQAFAKACDEADAADIIEGAATWFAAFAAGDGPRYLPQLAAWLANRGWEKPPPAKARRAYGTGRRNDGLPRTNADKVDLAKVFFGIAGYAEDDDGRMVRGGVE